jgi:hypothetical protein
MYPDADISALAAAGAVGITAEQAGALLHELARVHLVTRRGKGRFALHDDILRAFAAEQASADHADANWRP